MKNIIYTCLGLGNPGMLLTNLRVSVTNNPGVEAEWEVVLEDSFPVTIDFESSGGYYITDNYDNYDTYDEYYDYAPVTKLTDFDLTVNVVNKRYVKFQVLTWQGSHGGLQYFDIVRTPRLKTSGETG